MVDNEHEQQPSTSWGMHIRSTPAEPKNGLIRSYSTTHRTFSRPFSAKSVYFYKEGDVFFSGVRVPISRHRYKTFESLLEDLNQHIYMPFGVRNITTPMGKTRINHIDELEHLGRYVASSSKPPRGLDMQIIEKRMRQQQQQQQKTSSDHRRPWITSSSSLPQKFRVNRAVGLNYISAKQVFFVLNGKGKFYRTLINPMKPPTMEQLLEEVSNGLEAAIFRFYASDGTRITSIADILSSNTPKIIACQRNERPFFETSVKLPEIRPSRYAPRSVYSNDSTNGVEKKAPQPPTQRFRNTRGDSQLSSADKDSGAGQSWHTSDGSDGRPESMTERKAQMMRDEKQLAVLTASEDDLILEEEDDAKICGSSDDSEERRVSRKRAAPDDARTRLPGIRATLRNVQQPTTTTRRAVLPEKRRSKKSRVEPEIRKRVPEKRKGRQGNTETSSEATKSAESKGLSGKSVPENRKAHPVNSEQPQTSSEATKSAESKGLSGKPVPENPENGKARPENSEQPQTSSEPSKSAESKDLSGESVPENLNSEQEHHQTSSEPSKSAESKDMEVKPDPEIPESQNSDPENRNFDPERSQCSSQASKNAESELLSKKPDPEIPENQNSDPENRKTFPENTNSDTEQPHTSSEASKSAETESRAGNNNPENPEKLPETSSDDPVPESNPETSADAETSRQLDDQPSSPETSPENRTTDPNGADQQEDELNHPESANPEKNTTDEQEITATQAATRIQAAFRGFRTRKKFREQLNEPTPPNVPVDQLEHIETLDDIHNEEGVSLQSAHSTAATMTYTIEVKIGFRYGADTEVDLHLILYGDDATSQRILLRQESDWLLTPQTKFIEGGTIRFFVESPRLGTLNKILIGHDNPGYGAGVHIEHIVIGENLLDGRQFLFFVNKWLDGGQVDGKIERVVFLSTFLYLTSRPIRADAVTQGRWEFILHSRKDEHGGTTSNLTIVGFGDAGRATNRVDNDRMLRDARLNPLIQVDFGVAIGQLLKVRFEIDGAGERPNYFLEYVEIRDLDTEERSAVSVNKWLVAVDDGSSMIPKKWQPFREVTVYRKTAASLPMTTYEGRVTLGDPSSNKLLMSNAALRLQLIGDFPNESGIFPIHQSKLTSGKTIYTFKIDMVSLGHIRAVRVIAPTNHFGSQLLAAFSLLHDVYEKCSASSIDVGSPLFVSEVSIRETAHAPFRHIFGVAAVRQFDDSFDKLLTVRLIEGLATTVKQSTKSKPAKQHFVLYMSVADGAHCEPPFVRLCDKAGNEYEMSRKGEPIDDVLTYQLVRAQSVGLVEKVRVGVDRIRDGFSTVINKMRLVELNTGTEVRFVLFAEMRPFETVEVTCVYPDVAPRISLLYYVTITTTSRSGAAFRPHLNLVGSDGDTGFRAFPDEPRSISAGATSRMEIEALRLGRLEAIRVFCSPLDGAETSAKWTARIDVVSEDEHVYTTSQPCTIKRLSSQPVEIPLVPV